MLPKAFLGLVLNLKLRFFDPPQTSGFATDPMLGKNNNIFSKKWWWKMVMNPMLQSLIKKHLTQIQAKG